MRSCNTVTTSSERKRCKFSVVFGAELFQWTWSGAPVDYSSIRVKGSNKSPFRALVSSRTCLSYLIPTWLSKEFPSLCILVTFFHCSSVLDTYLQSRLVQLCPSEKNHDPPPYCCWPCRIDIVSTIFQLPG